MAYLITAACTGCGACVAECPTGSIAAGRLQFHIDADSCADHAACVQVCPVRAIRPMPAAAWAPLEAVLAREQAERGGRKA